jgi:WXG100 family type VII secretion target
VSADTIQARYDELDRVAGRFAKASEASAELHARIMRCVEALERGGWQGRGADAFFAEMHGTLYPASQRLIKALAEGRAVTLQVKDILRAAEEEAADRFKQGALPLVPGYSHGSETDRRVEVRVEADERWRRPAGGDRGQNHLSYDWAGGAILERYLTGGDDWIIRNDPNWTKYMQSNTMLTEKLGGQAVATAQQLMASGAGSMTINETSAMEIENGEGVVGYQYLHGTNANVGGFQRQGTATATPNSAGGYTVEMNMTYTWNDVIDPNPQYNTDTLKSRIAEIATLGRADPYEIHISWDETTVVELDSQGKQISIQNK